MRKTITVCDQCEESFNGEDAILFVFNGKEMDICGVTCFLKFWSIEYELADQNHRPINASSGTIVLCSNANNTKTVNNE